MVWKLRDVEVVELVGPGRGGAPGLEMPSRRL